MPEPIHPRRSQRRRPRQDSDFEYEYNVSIDNSNTQQLDEHSQPNESECCTHAVKDIC